MYNGNKGLHRKDAIVYMEKKALVVIDMQNDFVTGSLGTKEAQAILPYLLNKVERYIADDWDIFVTLDTHQPDYLQSREGKKLPVVHCVEGTTGWETCPEVEALVKDAPHFNKDTFGSTQLVDALMQGGYDKIELVGVCTDICVISNALLLRAHMPEVEISVGPKACAGVTPAQHETALQAMQACQIDILTAS